MDSAALQAALTIPNFEIKKYNTQNYFYKIEIIV